MVFDPHDLPPVYAPTVRVLDAAPDVRHAVGNISARIRREGTPSTFGEWDRLIRSTPAAR